MYKERGVHNCVDCCSILPSVTMLTQSLCRGQTCSWTCPSQQVQISPNQGWSGTWNYNASTYFNVKFILLLKRAYMYKSVDICQYWIMFVITMGGVSAGTPAAHTRGHYETFTE